jgi:hypothetical protein
MFEFIGFFDEDIEIRLVTFSLLRVEGVSGSGGVVMKILLTAMMGVDVG